MFTKNPLWYRNVALAGIGTAIFMVPTLEGLLHAQLPLVIRIPLVLAVLNVMAGGAMVAGVCFLEYQQRTQNVKTGV